jgi:hypothetical protein
MPLSERQIETTGDLTNTRTLVFNVLSAKGYKVQQDLNTRIIANHSLSATNYPHKVQIDLDFTQQGNGRIIMMIDHTASSVYIDKLAGELRNILPKGQTQMEPTANFTSLIPLKGMNENEYHSCINNLGLLEGEEIRLQYVCQRSTFSPPSMWDGKVKQQINKGLLVFTNDNMIFMQQEGAWCSSYGQALRFPLENISGIVAGGTLIKHIRLMVGISGSTEQHEFINFMSTYGNQQIQDVRADIEKLLKTVREEKKKSAIEAITKGTVPAMVFCKYCGTRNKADRSNCANCGAVLT